MMEPSSYIMSSRSFTSSTSPLLPLPKCFSRRYRTFRSMRQRSCLPSRSSYWSPFLLCRSFPTLRCHLCPPVSCRQLSGVCADRRRLALPSTLLCTSVPSWLLGTDGLELLLHVGPCLHGHDRALLSFIRRRLFSSQTQCGVPC